MKIKNRAGNIIEVTPKIYERMLKKGEVVQTITPLVGKETSKKVVKKTVKKAAKRTRKK